MPSLVDMAAAKEAVAEETEATAAAMEVAAMVGAMVGVGAAMVGAAMEMRWGWQMEERIIKVMRAMCMENGCLRLVMVNPAFGVIN